MIFQHSEKLALVEKGTRRTAKKKSSQKRENDNRVKNAEGYTIIENWSLAHLVIFSRSYSLQSFVLCCIFEWPRHKLFFSTFFVLFCSILFSSVAAAFRFLTGSFHTYVHLYRLEWKISRLKNFLLPNILLYIFLALFIFLPNNRRLSTRPLSAVGDGTLLIRSCRRWSDTRLRSTRKYTEGNRTFNKLIFVGICSHSSLLFGWLGLVYIYDIVKL